MTPAERREALVALANEQRSVALRLKALGPECRFCIHGPLGPKGLCQHPLFWRARKDAANGAGFDQSMMSTIKARSEEGLCGPEGQLFEPRSVAVRLWRAIRPHLGI